MRALEISSSVGLLLAFALIDMDGSCTAEGHRFGVFEKALYIFSTATLFRLDGVLAEV